MGVGGGSVAIIQLKLSHVELGSGLRYLQVSMAWVGLVHFAHRYYLYTFTSLFLSQILLFRLVMVFSSKPKPNTKMGLDDHLFDFVLRAHRSEMGNCF